MVIAGTREYSLVEHEQIAERKSYIMSCEKWCDASYVTSDPITPRKVLVAPGFVASTKNQPWLM
jgi:hypothetical protein